MRVGLMAGACAAAILTASSGTTRADGIALGSIAAGQVSIAAPTPSLTTITQTSDKALINWQSFSIATGSTVQFLQPGSSSITLNRVTGPGASIINGNLFANGQVWLINGNGVLFGAHAQVNVGGLIATTADMRDSDFLSGHYEFSKASANPNAGIENRGAIRAAPGGSAVLAGPRVSNQGLIQADLGKVVLAGGSTFSVDFSGDNLLRFAVTTPADSAQVSNSGTLSAQGGRVTMTARAASNVVDNVINSTGIVQATSAIEKDGEIILDAGDGAVSVAGTLDASGAPAGAKGGHIEILGGDVRVTDGAVLDASGDAGGGTILIGGNLRGLGPQPNAQTTTVGEAAIKADAISGGDGGTIVVWADTSTSFAAQASARGGVSGGNGGLVETSGHNLALGAAAKVDTSAASGNTGAWLLDPQTITIMNSGFTPIPPGGTIAAADPPTNATISPAALTTALATTNVMLQAVTDIIVTDPVVYSSVNSLTLLAGHHVNINANVQNQQATGGGAIYAIGGWDGTTTNLASLANVGVYGNGTGNVHVGFVTGNVAIGSLSGTTTVAGRSVLLDSSTGDAQIGYRGVGQGNISVSAVFDVTLNSPSPFAKTLIGNGGTATPGSTGDVTIDAGTIVNIAASAANDLVGGNVTLRAYIANPLNLDKPIAYNSGKTFSVLAAGSINVTASIQNDGPAAINLVAGWDAVTMSAAAVIANPAAFGNNNGSVIIGAAPTVVAVGTKAGPGPTTIAGWNVTVDGNQGAAQIGYRGVGHGAIVVQARNTVSVVGNNPLAPPLIGNGGTPTPGSTGPVTIEAGTIVGVAASIASDLAGGNVFIKTHSLNPFAVDGAIVYNSANTFAVLAAGDISIAHSVQNAGAGAINLLAGWDQVTVPAFNVPPPANAFGNNNGSIVVGGTAALGNAAVGTATGPLALAGRNVILDAVNGYAQIGYHNAGGGSISVVTKDKLVLKAQTSNTARFAQVGNGSVAHELSGNITGDIFLNIGGRLEFVEAVPGPGGFGWIGNVAGSGIASGNLTIKATDTDDNGGSKFGDMIRDALGTTAAPGSGGDVMVGFTGPNDGGNGTLKIDDTASFTNLDTSHSLTVASSLDLTVATSIQNAGGGAMTFVAGWDGVTTDPAALSNPAAFAQNGHGTIVIGGADAAGNVAIGSQRGTVTFLGKGLDLIAAHGYAQLGYHGAANAPISVTMTDGVHLSAGATDQFFAQIGHGGYLVGGRQAGNIVISAAGDVRLHSGAGANAYTQIGHGGALSNRGSTGYTLNGDITVNGADVKLDGAGGTGAYAQIGHGGDNSGSGMSSGTGQIGGVITVTATGEVFLTGGGNSAYAQIGHGGSFINSGSQLTPASFTIGGTIVVSDLTLQGGTGNVAYALIGNGDLGASGSGTVSGDITITSVANIVLTNGTGLFSGANIGNFIAAGTATGTVTGYTAPPPPPAAAPTVNATTIGTIVTLTASNQGQPGAPNNFAPAAPPPPPAGNQPGAPAQQIAMAMPQGDQPGPIEQLEGDGGPGEDQMVADTLSQSVADSVNSPKPTNRVTIIDGLLQQLVTPAAINPTGVPPAGEQFSSWGNEALWQP